MRGEQKGIPGRVCAKIEACGSDRIPFLKHHIVSLTAFGSIVTTSLNELGGGGVTCAFFLGGPFLWESEE